MEYECVSESSQVIAEEEKGVTSFSENDPNSVLVNHPHWFQSIVVPDHIDVRVYAGKESAENNSSAREDDSKKRGRDGEDGSAGKKSDRKGPEWAIFDVPTPPNVANWKQEDAKSYEYTPQLQYAKPPPKPRMTLKEIEARWPTLRSSPPHPPGFWHEVINKRTGRPLTFVTPVGTNHFSNLYPFGNWAKTNPKPPESSKVQLPNSITDTKYELKFSSEAFDDCQQVDGDGNSQICLEFVEWVKKLNTHVVKLLLQKNRGWKQRFKATSDAAALISQTIQTLKLHRSQIKACVRRIQRALSKSTVHIEAKDDEEFLQRLEEEQAGDVGGEIAAQYDSEDLVQAKESQTYITRHKNLVERYDLLMENKRYDDSQGVDVVTNWRHYEAWPTLEDIDSVVLESVNDALVKEYKGKFTVKMTRKVFKKKPAKKQKTSGDSLAPTEFDPALAAYPEFMEAVKTHNWMDLPLYTVNDNGDGVLVPIAQRQLRVGDVIYSAVNCEAFDTSPQDTMGVRLVPVMVYKVRDGKKYDRDAPGNEERYVVSFRPQTSAN